MFQSEEKDNYVIGIANMNAWNFKHPIKNLTKMQSNQSIALKMYSQIYVMENYNKM
jgi:hypothetical protein